MVCVSSLLSLRVGRLETPTVAFLLVSEKMSLSDPVRVESAPSNTLDGILFYLVR